VLDRWQKASSSLHLDDNSNIIIHSSPNNVNTKLFQVKHSGHCDVLQISMPTRWVL